MRAPPTIGKLLAYVAIGWLGLNLIGLLISFFSIYAEILAILVFLVSTFAAGRETWKLLRARQRVLASKKEKLLFGLVELIAWDPVEGVLFLKNKSLGFSDSNLHDGSGGIRFMYPIFGEELALRVPLEVQTLEIVDDSVFTREYLSISIRETMKWRIKDVSQFYLRVSRETQRTEVNANRPAQTNYADEIGRGGSSVMSSKRPSVASENTTRQNLMMTAINWLRFIAEEQTRIVFSRVSTGLLVADRLSAELPELKSATDQGTRGMATPGGHSEWSSGADELAGRILKAVSERVADYGIEIDDVSLQDVRLPQQIIEQCREACKAAYLPLLAEREASHKRARLAVEVDLLGRDAAATKAVVGAAPAFSLVDFLGQYLNKQMAASANSGLAGTFAALPAAEAMNYALEPPKPALAAPEALK